MKNRIAFSLLTLVGIPAVSSASVIDTTPGLVYHLDAASGVTASGGLVSAWNDQTVNGNNFSQSTTSKQPTLVSSSPAFNNHPVIQFNGDLTGAGTTAPNASRLVLPNTSTAQTVFIVESTTTSNGLAGIWGQNEADTGIRRNSTSAWQINGVNGNGNDFPNSVLINGTPGGAQANDGTGAVLMAVSNSPMTFGATGLGEYFDCCGAGARPWGGSIAEVAVYSGTLTTGQQQAVESYLFNKYFAPTPEPSSLAVIGAAVGLFGVRRRRRNI